MGNLTLHEKRLKQLEERAAKIAKTYDEMIAMVEAATQKVKELNGMMLRMRIERSIPDKQDYVEGGIDVHPNPNTFIGKRAVSFSKRADVKIEGDLILKGRILFEDKDSK